jgi:hypothetical protein
MESAKATIEAAHRKVRLANPKNAKRRHTVTPVLLNRFLNSISLHEFVSRPVFALRALHPLRPIVIGEEATYDDDS